MLQSSYFQECFCCENSRKDVIHVVENRVTNGIVCGWIFEGQRYATQTDDDHDEVVERSQVNKEMCKFSNAEYP